MIEFLKILLKKANFKSDNEEINSYRKIIYTIIIVCAIFFIGFIIYSVITQLPNFLENIEEAWENSNTTLNIPIK